MDRANFGIDSLAVDSRSIYFGASVWRDSSNQMIYELGRCDITGCASPTFLAMANRPFAHILSDEQFLYFTATTLPSGIDDCSSHKTVDIGIPCNQPQGFVGEMAITW